jgi:diguanylate cyclase
VKEPHKVFGEWGDKPSVVRLPLSGKGVALAMKLLARLLWPGAKKNVMPLSGDCSDFQTWCGVLLRSVSTTLQFIKSLALDVEEIKSGRFKEDLQQLDERLSLQENPRQYELCFEQKKETIASFIKHQQAYIIDRERELRDIIDLLTKAMAHLNIENREFYQRLNHQGEKIFQLSGLDDIKRIKNALKAEVEQMWELVNLKQDQEKCRMRSLSDQVHALKDELEKAKSKAMTDGLTGAYNRQALDDFLAEKIERSSADHTDFCIFMIDIDNFKHINDKFGHVIGDRVLAALARKCREFIRSEDFLARYGGEEFALVMLNMSFRNALKKAQHLCSTIASVRYATTESQFGDYLSMTVSIGVTQYKKGDTAGDIITRADQALYQAKRKGKNCAIGRKA